MVANVLLLEPSDDVRELVRWTLTQLGHTVSGDGADSAQVAAIILEPADPEALRTARALLARQPELTVICASIEPPHRIEGLGPDVYLVKPFPLKHLETALEQLQA